MSEEQTAGPDMSRPNRQSPVGVVVYMARNFRAFITIMISVLAVGASQPKIWIYLGIGFIPLVVAFMLLAYWQYRNFTFHVSDDELIIHRGVLVKDRMVIPAQRIQTIQITQNLIQRIVGLVGLKVDTAGSKGSELEIPALERDRARRLQELLYLKKERILAERESDDASETGAPDGESAAEKAQRRVQSRTGDRGRVLVKLGVGDLFVVGITENHLKTGIIALAVVFGYLNQYREFIQSYFSDYVDSYADQVANAGLTVLLVAIVLFAVLSILISLMRTVLRFANLRAVLHSDAIRISTGLIRRDENRVPIKKIQYIEWDTNPLRRLVGYESAKIKPSGAVDKSGGNQTIEIPALRKPQSALLAENAFPGFHIPETRVRADARGYARLYGIVAGAVALPMTFGMYFAVGWYALVFLLAVALAALLGLRYGKSVLLRPNAHFITVFRGWIFPVRIVIPTYKVQAVSLEQSVFLVRRGLCHLRIHTAAGDKLVRYLNEEQAFELKNFILYIAESHKGHWM